MKTYIECLTEKLLEYPIGVPIYSSELAKYVADYYNMDEKKALAAVSTAMSRIIDTKQIDGLRSYQKGIFYITKETPFGEVGINEEKLIADKYLADDMGYEGGEFILRQMGLTNQIARHRIIVSNRANACARKDAKLNIIVKPPKTHITQSNKEYLRLLDALEMINSNPIDDENPYNTISKYIRAKALSYEILLGLAHRYYNKNTVMELAHTAGIGEFFEGDDK